ncbi:hypothetical protein EJC49_17025 [Aquibium carbonis]|uniref:Uncharacterized protein n=1 Tax=Aquibium carbonis TaxID=2495581 RepID=A0A3R9Y6F4_9HYPH|nr:hypothetical protein [Aquibium carbonis]RST85180.1 hypothetical protein EJC49_17025 [Aquibium carbonis]
MTMRMRLPGGTLKIKRYIELRHAERKREVPVIVVGGLYFVWWSEAATRRRAARMRHSDLAENGSESPQS